MIFFEISSITRKLLQDIRVSLVLNLPWYKIFKILIFCGFLYQFFDLTIKYTKYEFTIETEFKNSIAAPAFTFCFERKNLLEKLRSNTGFFGCRIGYYFNITVDNCPYNLTREYLVRQRKKSICLTWFYENLIELNERLNFLIFRIFDIPLVEIIIHPHYNPSHFEKNENLFIYMKKNLTLWLSFRKTTRNLLQNPYSTDCYDYSFNIGNNIWPKSQTECLLEYMRQKEIKNCDKSFYSLYWNQFYLEDNSKLFYDFGECKIQYDSTAMMNCKPDCNQNIYHVLKEEQELLKPPMNMYIMVPFSKSFNQEITMGPKMDFSNYLATLGGLLTMWMKLDVLSITKLLINFIFKIILNFSSRKNRGNYTNLILRYFRMIISRIFTIMLFYYMSIQIYKFLDEYIKNNKMTVLNPITNLFIPDIYLVTRSQVDLVRDPKYASFKEEKRKEMNSVAYVDWLQNYEAKYISEIFYKNITEYLYVTNQEDMKLTCSIEFDFNEAYECHFESFFIFKYVQLDILNRVKYNSTKKTFRGDQMNLKKITLESKNYFLNFELTLSDYYSNDQFYKKQDNLEKTTLVLAETSKYVLFSSYSIQKIESNTGR